MLTKITTLFLMLATIGFGQQIKRKTELALPLLDKPELNYSFPMALKVAESKTEKGRGNGTGMMVVAGLAAAQGKPLPDAPDDPEKDSNLDPSTPLKLEAGAMCHVGTWDKVIVLGVDGNQVLVEDERLSHTGKHEYHPYRGPKFGPSMQPAQVVNGTVNYVFMETPVCLDKIKLWIDRDVFLAFLARPVTTKQRAKKGDSEEDKAAVRRATGNN